MRRFSPFHKVTKPTLHNIMSHTPFPFRSQCTAIPSDSGKPLLPKESAQPPIVT